MCGAFRWTRVHGLKLLAFTTLAASVSSAAFVGYLWRAFDIKSQALARAGSESAGYMEIATRVLGQWILPALVVVSVLALATFAAALRRRQQPAPA